MSNLSVDIIVTSHPSSFDRDFIALPTSCSLIGFPTLRRALVVQYLGVKSEVSKVIIISTVAVGFNLTAPVMVLRVSPFILSSYRLVVASVVLSHQINYV